MLGVKLLTNADQTVAAQHTKRKRKGNQGGKTKEKGENNFIKFHVVYKIISALEFRHKQVPWQYSSKVTNEKCSVHIIRRVYQN